MVQFNVQQKEISITKEFFDVDIHPKQAKLLWEKLHESRDKLLVFEESRKELKETINRLSN